MTDKGHRVATPLDRSKPPKRLWEIVLDREKR